MQRFVVSMKHVQWYKTNSFWNIRPTAEVQNIKIKQYSHFNEPTINWIWKKNYNQRIVLWLKFEYRPFQPVSFRPPHSPSPFTAPVASQRNSVRNFRLQTTLTKVADVSRTHAQCTHTRTTIPAPRTYTRSAIKL